MIDTCLDPLPKLGYFKQLCLPVPTHAVRLKQETKGKKCSRGYVRNQSFFQLPVSQLHEERELREKASCAQSIDAWPQSFKKSLRGACFRTAWPLQCFRTADF